MVSSKINETINYPETKTIDDEDKGYQSPLYELDLELNGENLNIVIVLGKQKYTFNKKGVIFYPIYVVAKDGYQIKIKSQIGVFEIQSERVLSVLDEDQDVDLTQLGEPLLYSFVSMKYLQKAKSIPEEFKQIEQRSPTKPVDLAEEKQNQNKEPQKTDSDSDSETEDILNLKLPKKTLSKEREHIKDTLENGIFTVNKSTRQPETLKEETHEDATEERLHFKESASNKWITNFLKNNNYDIVETSSNGDCLFDVIRLAFESVGKSTTVQKLRALVANELTDEIYRENRNLYLSFEGEIKEYEMEMKEIKKSIDEYGRRIKKTEAREEKQHILDQVEVLKKKYSEAKEKKKTTEDYQQEYIGHIKEIDSLEKYRAYIQTSSYWADAWSISTLENILNIKLMILNEMAFRANSLDSVFECGELNANIQTKGHFTPNFYIVASYSGNHYRLITYKRKQIFTFSEVPYDMKILAIKKCLEKNAGPYYLIQDFRNLQSNLGIDPDEANPKRDEEEIGENEYYDSDVVFSFNNNSMDAPPGKGNKEQIPGDKITQFMYLNKIKDWRKKLDDKSTAAPFKVDHHRWASVYHYMCASKYKKGNPDFYLLFTLDSGNPISESIDVAKHAVESGKMKDKILRPKNVKKDLDYELREDEDREEAVRAKFSQNQDMKEILLGTKRALLKKAVHGNPSTPDLILMKIRKELV